jgi:hypothetical protein
MFGLWHSRVQCRRMCGKPMTRALHLKLCRLFIGPSLLLRGLVLLGIQGFLLKLERGGHRAPGDVGARGK